MALIFFYCLVLFIAGVAVGNFFILPHFYIFCLLLILILGLLITVINKKNLRYRNFFLFASCLVLGFWRYAITLPNYEDAGKIYHYSSSTVDFIGTIKSIDNRSSGQKATVAVKSLRSAVEQSAVNGLVLVSLPLYPEYNYGDSVKVKCFLKRPGLIEDFDYGKYLAKSGIYVYCGFGEVSRLESAPPSLLKLFYNFKIYLLKSLNASISEPQVSLLRGILLGDGRGLPEKYALMFADLGLTHVIAISGDHIAIIAVTLLELFILFGVSRRRAFWPLAIIIFFYVALVGAPASAVRSAIMALAVMYAQVIGRASRGDRALVLAATIMILINPLILMSDVGFQLSFMAVWGLGHISPLFNKKLQNWPDLLRIKEILIATLSAQIATLPLLLYYFGKLSLISVVANIVILPVIPFLTIYGLANLVVSAIYLPLGQILGWVSWLICAYWIEVSEWLHLAPYGYFTINNFGPGSLIVCYLVIFGLYFKFNRQVCYNSNNKKLNK